MDIIWIIVAIVGVLIFWLLLKVALGFLLPPKITGKNYVRQKLKRMEIGKNIVSDECIIELVDIFIGIANMHKTLGGRYFNDGFLESLDGQVCYLLLWIDNPNDPSFNDDDIFKRHNVPTKKQGQKFNEASIYENS